MGLGFFAIQNFAGNQCFQDSYVKWQTSWTGGFQTKSAHVHRHDLYQGLRSGMEIRLLDTVTKGIIGISST